MNESRTNESHLRMLCACPVLGIAMHHSVFLTVHLGETPALCLQDQCLLCFFLCVVFVAALMQFQCPTSVQSPRHHGLFVEASRDLLFGSIKTTGTHGCDVFQGFVNAVVGCSETQAKMTSF